MTRGFSSPSEIAAIATSASALAYAGAWAERDTESPLIVGVGPGPVAPATGRGVLKSSDDRPPPVSSDQSTKAPFAGSATVAASDSPSRRATAGSTPASRAACSSAASASPSDTGGHAGGPRVRSSGPCPNLASRNLPCSNSAWASARLAASRILSIVEPSSSSWSMSTISEVL